MEDGDDDDDGARVEEAVEEEEEEWEDVGQGDDDDGYGGGAAAAGEGADYAAATQIAQWDSLARDAVAETNARTGAALAAGGGNYASAR